MAYRTGSVNSYEELRGVLISACTAAGWSLQDGILVKGAAFIRPYVSIDSYPNGAGLSLEGGSGRNGGTITGSSDKFRPRLGSPTAKMPNPNWPCAYHIFCHSNPDEVYVILRHDVDAYYWLTFGISQMPGIDGAGLWMSATTAGQKSPASTVGGCYMDETGGNPDAISLGGFTSGPWWSTMSTGLNRVTAAIMLDVWVPCGRLVSQGANAIEPLVPLVAHSPSSWNAESVLLPIRVHQGVAESKHRVVLEHAHARYLRLNNLEPEQVLTIGTERWKVFPFYRKNTISPNSVSGALHTGTFGWAIRYDGP